MLILTVGLEKYKGQNIKLFVVASILLTYFEYLAGFALDAIFGLKWWDYSQDFLNINGRICLAFALVWGFFALFVINIVHPFTEKMVDKILSKMPSLSIHLLTKILVMILVIDFCLSSLDYLIV